MTGPGKAAWVFSLLLHGGLVGLLLFGPSLRPTQKPQLPVGVIDAVILDAEDIQRLVDMEIPEPDPKLQAQRKEEERQRQLERDRLEQDRIKRKKDEEERQRKIEEDKAAAKAEADRVAAEKEKARVKAAADEKAALAKALADKKAAEKKAAAEKAAREKALAEKKAAEEKAIADKKAADKKAAEEKAAREKAIADKKAAEAKAAAERKKELERQLQQARIDELQQQLGVEERRTNAVDSGQLAEYVALITAKVYRSWNRPPGTPPGLSCKVKANQIPGGEVVSVAMLSCNGNEAVQRSILAAVRKASPLPDPPDPTLFERTILITFEPEE